MEVQVGREASRAAKGEVTINGETQRLIVTPILLVIMSMLSNMNIKFDGMKDDMRDVRESFFRLEERGGRVK